MMQALLIKELRESAGLLAVAAIACGFLLAALTGFPLVPWQSDRLYTLPFVSDGLPTALWLAGGGLAILLGLKQTAWESSFNTYYFLLHRPIARWKVFALKLAFGVAVVLGVTGLFLLLYAAWAATPGAHDAPFLWSMTLPACKQWMALPLLYLGAFYSGIRPGRWFGTRLAPLVVTIPAAVGVASLPWYVRLGPLGLLLWVLVAVVALVGIFYHVRNRDY